jgi:hypothetical protein
MTSLLALLLCLGGLTGAGCHPRSLPDRGQIRLRSDLKPRSPAHIAPHGFARYSGDLRFVKRSMSVSQVHVPGRFETCARVYSGLDGRQVSIIATVHVAERRYYQALEQLLKDAETVLYEDLRGSRKALGLNPDQQQESGRWAGQKRLFESQGLGSLDWRRADMDMAEVLIELKKVGVEIEDVSGSNQPGSSKAELSVPSFHLLGLSLVGRATGTGPSEELPRGLYKLSAADFLEKRPWFMNKADYAWIYRRNDRVMAGLRRALKDGRKKIALLYGAAHCFDLEDRLLAMGFERQAERWLIAWNLRKD